METSNSPVNNNVAENNDEQATDSTQKKRFFQWLAQIFTSNDIDFDTDDTSAGKELTIMYGTQTGNAQTVAEDTVEQAKLFGIDVALRDMEDLDIVDLKEIDNLLIVTSTFDNGGMPDNSELLWESVCDPSAPMLNKHYAVLGLGDSTYLNFCQAGKEWDARLEGLGCQRLVQRVDCDVDYETPAQLWMDTVLPIVAKRCGKEVSESMAHSTAPVDTSLHSKEERLNNPRHHEYKHNSKHPIKAILKDKKILTQAGSSKEIVHYELDLVDSDEVYFEGDSINIVPHNKEILVNEILDYFKEAESSQYSEDIKNRLTHELEIRTPSIKLIEIIGARGSKETASKLKILLHNYHISSTSDRDSIDDFLRGIDTIELLNLCLDRNSEDKKEMLTFDEFIANCEPLTARAYSISSSNRHVDNEVHVTVSSVRYPSNGVENNLNQSDRIQHGVASTFLADIAQIGDTLDCYFSATKSFKLPKNNEVPIIMVGPGTGISPFRAFLQARQAMQATGDNWLIFGERNKETDFIYQQELETMQETGLLKNLSLAFSRDQTNKVYVQDRMIEAGAELFSWLERGAYFYVCGDARRMAKDVEDALHKIITKHGHMNELEAIDYIDRLRKEKRYVKDVY